MSVNRLTFATLAIACTLVACKQPDPAPAETEEPPATAPAATGTEVTRQEQPAEPAPSSGPIASQPGAKGSTWELTRAAVAALQAPAVRERLTANGYVLAPGTPEEWPGYLQAGTAKWGEVIRSRGITLE